MGSLVRLSEAWQERRDCDTVRLGSLGVSMAQFRVLFGAYSNMRASCNTTKWFSTPAGGPTGEPSYDTVCLEVVSGPTGSGLCPSELPHLPLQKFPLQVRVVTWASDLPGVDWRLPQPLLGFDWFTTVAH